MERGDTGTQERGTWGVGTWQRGTCGFRDLGCGTWENRAVGTRAVALQGHGGAGHGDAGHGVHLALPAGQGGVLGIKIGWVCDLDRSWELCLPRYSFTRLDGVTRHSPSSPGYNFR